ncbi:hypothetical protein LZC95_21210 [Pendulispora brunnea]|uniref:Uncharacterized protein n=1 Tax=Pendulispora brunnea TaxID=2905690 RepID=A0ABZ2KKZ6_9BACT
MAAAAAQSAKAKSNHAAPSKGAAAAVPGKAPKRPASPSGRMTAKEAHVARGDIVAPATSGEAGVAPVRLTAKERARLQAVTSRAGEQGQSAKMHQSAQSATEEARAAAREPKAEADGKALGEHAAKLEDSAPPDPEIVKKAARIRQLIREKRPLDEDDLGKAKPREMAQAAGEEVAGDVRAAAQGVKTGYEPVHDKPEGHVTKEVLPIPPLAAAPPAPAVNAATAAPDPVAAGEVSLEADKNAMASRSKAAGLDRPEAALVQDGPVAAARAARGEFGELAIWGPAQVVKGDKELRAAATADFAQAEAQALARMKKARADKLAAVEGEKIGAISAEERKREALGKTLEAIYAVAEDKVRAKLEPLADRATKMWDDGLDPISKNFEQTLARVDHWIKERRESTLSSIRDFFAGLPDWIVEAYDKAETEFGEQIGELAISVSKWVNTVIRDCQQIIAEARREIQKTIAGLDGSFKEFALDKEAEIGKKFDALSTEVEGARKNFTQELTGKLTSTVAEKRAKVDALREQSKGLWQKFEDAVGEFIDDPVRAIVNGLLRIVGIPPASFWALVDKFGAVVDQIADKPMVFANNLLEALKLGFNQFKDNIVSHLGKGLLTWLTSKMKDAGIVPPSDFSVKSLLTFFLQILGVSWPKIRAKLVKHIGEKNIARIELAVQFLTTFINEGWEGLWKLVKDKLDPEQIVTAVKEAIVSYVTQAVVTRAVEWVVSLFNPAGAVFQALKLIYNAVMWVVNNAARIFSLVEAVVNGAANILSGAIGGAANLIEKALGMLVPVVIDLFARLLGLGGIPDEVKKTVGGLQAAVDAGLDKVIDWVAAKLALSDPPSNSVAKKDAQLDSQMDGETAVDPNARTNDEQRSRAVKIKARVMLSGPIAAKIHDRETLLNILDNILRSLRPEGLKTLKAAPVEGRSQDFRIVASASAEEEVGKAHFESGETIKLAEEVNKASDDAKARRFLFRADDEWVVGTPIGLPLDSEEANTADIQTPWEHVSEKKGTMTSRYVSFSEIIGSHKGGAAKFTRKDIIAKAVWEALQTLQKEGKIRILTPNDVVAMMQAEKPKVRRLASAVKADMEKNKEILIEGQIPAEYLTRAKQ